MPVRGRDPLIADLWQRLDQQSVLVNAERRIGKTSLLRKMASEPAPGWFPAMLDVEGFHRSEEFAVAVYEQVQTYLSVFKRSMNAARRIYEEHEFGDFKRTAGRRPWKALLTAAIQDLLSQKEDQRLVFIWDEIPYMIHHIRHADGGQTAVEVLDTLRGLRLRRHEDARECYEKALGLTGAEPARAFQRCEARMYLGHWEAGFEELRKFFESYPKNTTHDARTIIDLIRGQSENEPRRQYLARLIAIYVEAGVLGYLGNELVRSFRRIARDRPDVKTLEAWRAAWLELGAGHAELEVPLRIFRVGVEYLIRNDERILLDLVSVERKILRQALGLEPTGEEASDILNLPGHLAVG